MKNIVDIVRICLKVIMIVLIISAVLFWPISYIKEKKINVKEFKENVSNPQLELYDLHTILFFDGHIWVSNSARDTIMVFSPDGECVKSISLPACTNGGVEMYIYHEQLCIMDKYDTVYQYSSIDEYKKIVLKDRCEVEIFNKAGKQINTLNLGKNYDFVLLYLDNKCYLSANENNYIAIYDKTGNVGKEKGDFETIVVGGDKVICADRNTVYEIGMLGYKIIKEENGKRVVFKSSGIIELFFLSVNIEFVKICIFMVAGLISNYIDKKY